ncbi:methyltransferase, partial [Massilia arenosa]
RRLVGVDLSAAMLERAQARGLYDVLACAELTEFLRAAPARAAYDVIVAADVLVYLGDLQPLFAAAGSALRPGGLFAFSVERAEGSVAGTGYLLQPSGRYAHAPAYIDSLPGFELLAAHSATLRQERGVPVDGMLYVLRASGFLTGAHDAS